MKKNKSFKTYLAFTKFFILLHFLTVKSRTFLNKMSAILPLANEQTICQQADDRRAGGRSVSEQTIA
jgi:hypothetical protein